MKLLFDQNLSFRLVKKLEEYFPDSRHVRLWGMDEDDDRAIWQYAKDNGFTIVTQDADFENLSQLYGFPPKVIWLRCGNTATANILNWPKNGQDLFVLLHGEVQGQAAAKFNERMFTYNYRIKDRYNAPVVSLGVVTGNTRKVQLGQYESELWGCRTTFEFPVVKMSGWRGREAELERSRNPFAMVVLVHLELPKAKGMLERKYSIKLNLIRQLLRHGFSANYVRSLLRFIDWVIQLPKELE